MNIFERQEGKYKTNYYLINGMVIMTTMREKKDSLHGVGVFIELDQLRADKSRIICSAGFNIL